ncbi:S8 family serine peptidase, partial [candidate division KSB1 bacterium]
MKLIHTRLTVILSLIVLVILYPGLTSAQTETNIEALQDFAQRKRAEWNNQRILVEDFALRNKIPVRKEFPDGRIIQLMRVDNSFPVYNITTNLAAAISTRTNTLWTGGSLGLNLTGSGYDKIGEWDGGAVRATHQEFDDGMGGSRVTQGDSPGSTSGHSTHVAGTMVAGGYDASAKGMAFEATLTAYDWNSDETEMATEAAAGMEVSNHSYSHITGWEYDCNADGLWCWYGVVSVSTTEDYRFGFYSSYSEDLDDLMYDAPYYLSVWSSGNDRNDYPASQPTTHWYHNGSSWVTTSLVTRDNDGGSTGYDCIGSYGTAKNVLTVGATEDVASYTGPSSVVITSFSSWGPADDGRIKPDIVANGASLYSSYSTSDNAYANSSGTSMAAPNTTGTLALLQQYYQQTHGSTPMYAATLKALVINTADECGSNTGPDYQFGWGLLNAEAAALMIADDTLQNVIDHQTITTGSPFYSRVVYSNGNEPLQVTIVWTDPAGTPVLASVDPSNVMLVNDLDLRITKGATTYYSWKLDRNNPSNAATNSAENNVDNVEQVFIASPAAGSYTITVDYDGTLTNSTQSFGIIINGIDEYSSVPPCASLVGPPDGATNVSLSQNMSWSAGSGIPATGYKLYLGTDGGGVSTPTNVENGTDLGLLTSYSLSSLSNSQTYYWKIVPYNAAGDATGCDIWEFTTAAGIVTGLWTGGTSTDWNTASNWDDNSVPTSSTDVTIPGGCTYYPDLSGDLTVGTSAGTYDCQSLTIQNGGSLEINDALTVTNSMTVDGEYTCTNSGSNSQQIGSGGSLTVSSNGVMKLGNQTSGNAYTDLVVNGGTLTITGGTLEIDDQFNLLSGTFNMSSGTLFAHKFGNGSTYGGSYYGAFYVAASGTSGSITGGIVKVCGKTGSGLYAVNILSSGFSFSGGTLELLHGDYGTHYDAYINTHADVDLYNVIINKTDNTVYSQSNLDINGDFTMQPETYFTVSTGTTVDIAGDILLESDATGMASFIDEGTLTHTGTATVEQYLSEDVWHLVTSPVSGATSNAYLDLYLKDYDETTNNWGAHITSTTLPLTVGKGYVVWSSSGSTGNATVNLQGSLNTGSISPTVSYSGASYGYNLIGNPYPSYIDWDASSGWSSTNVGTTIWIWNPNGSWGNYVRGSSGVGTNDVTNIIPPTQGFFVRTNASSPLISMNNDVRIHDNSQAFLKNTSGNITDLIRLRVEGNNLSDETIINFKSYASNTFNDYDAEKWFSSNQYAPNLYSIKNNFNLSINTLKDYSNGLAIPLGFIPGSDSTYI